MFRSFLRDESGATHIEYGLIVTLIGISLIVAFTALRDTLVDQFTGVADAVSVATG